MAALATLYRKRESPSSKLHTSFNGSTGLSNGLFWRPLALLYFLSLLVFTFVTFYRRLPIDAASTATSCEPRLRLLWCGCCRQLAKIPFFTKSTQVKLESLLPQSASSKYYVVVTLKDCWLTHSSHYLFADAAAALACPLPFQTCYLRI